jgi:Holliday junction resolvase-like predicted endonuclease
MPANADERRAARHYRLRGYRILGTNVWAGGNELDLIVRRGRRLVFCEVKGKSGTGWGDPLEMVDEEKLRRVRRAAEAWLAARPECRGLECSVEVVAVRAGRLERVPAERGGNAAPPPRAVRFGLPGGTIPERAHSSERLRPGCAGRSGHRPPAGETSG